MPRYNFSLGNTVTKNGKPFLTQPPVTWHDVDEHGLNALLAMSDKNAAEYFKAANKGGKISITATREVVALDGGAIPKDANNSITVTGLTLHSLTDLEDDLAHSTKELNKFGRQHAESKEGKKP